jgi:hypothetical protein
MQMYRRNTIASANIPQCRSRARGPTALLPHACFFDAYLLDACLLDDDGTAPIGPAYLSRCTTAEKGTR